MKSNWSGWVVPTVVCVVFPVMIPVMGLCVLAMAVSGAFTSEVKDEV